MRPFSMRVRLPRHIHCLRNHCRRFRLVARQRSCYTACANAERSLDSGEDVVMGLSTSLPNDPFWTRRATIRSLIVLMTLSLISCAIPALPGQTRIAIDTSAPTATPTVMPSPTAFPYSYEPARPLLAKVVTTGPHLCDWRRYSPRRHAKCGGRNFSGNAHP